MTSPRKLSARFGPAWTQRRRELAAYTDARRALTDVWRSTDRRRLGRVLRNTSVIDVLSQEVRRFAAQMYLAWDAAEDALRELSHALEGPR